MASASVSTIFTHGHFAGKMSAVHAEGREGYGLTFWYPLDPHAASRDSRILLARQRMKDLA